MTTDDHSVLHLKVFWLLFMQQFLHLHEWIRSCFPFFSPPFSSSLSSQPRDSGTDSQQLAQRMKTSGQEVTFTSFAAPHGLNYTSLHDFFVTAAYLDLFELFIFICVYRYQSRKQLVLLCFLMMPFTILASVTRGPWRRPSFFQGRTRPETPCRACTCFLSICANLICNYDKNGRIMKRGQTSLNIFNSLFLRRQEKIFNHRDEETEEDQ